MLADDHPVVLEGLCRLVDSSEGMEVIERCTTGTAVLDAILRHHPDVVLLDVHMPQPDGLAVLREVRRRGLDTRIILLTASMQDDAVLEAVRLGIHGLVAKDAAGEDLIGCIRGVAAGETRLDPTLVGRAMAKLLKREAALSELSSLLTAREIEVVQMVVSGMRNREIGERLFVSEGTVKVHLYHIYQKLGVQSREQLVAYVREKGLAE